MNRWIDAFCDAYLDEEYAYLSKKMLAKLARKRPSPLERGGPGHLGRIGRLHRGSGQFPG